MGHPLFHFSHSALCIAFAALAANAATLLKTSDAARTFRMDTTGPSYAVTTEAGLSALWPLTYRAGDSIAETAPDGAETALVADAASGGTRAWTPSYGGTWTLVNDVEGEAVFRVWHSIFGLDGAGTAANPAKVVDAGDFAATLALAGNDKDGFTFALDGVASTASFAVPAGYAVESLGEGVYRLAATSDGRLVSSAPDAFPMDTLRPGPDRKLRTKAEVLPFAYSGDLWAGTNATAASTLSYSGPAGFADTASRTGTGAMSFALPHSGSWLVTLTPAEGEPLVAHIDIVTGTFMLMR